MKTLEQLKYDAYQLVQLLEVCGCKKVYQGDEKEGYQSLLFDGNSGTVFSVEVIPWENSAEIRTSSSQRQHFPTEQILDGISMNIPLFSNYLVSQHADLPLVSLMEEKELYCMPIASRVELLMGAPVDAYEIYLMTGQVPGVDREELQRVEKNYDLDYYHKKSQREQIVERKMHVFPDAIQSFYQQSIPIEEKTSGGMQKIRC